MTQPLNYTPKAIEGLLSYPCAGAPGVRDGIRYLADKLREAQVFVLPDHGQLLDRSRGLPPVPGQSFRPPFPVVALEYSALTNQWDDPVYCPEPSSRRIALAWEWRDDLPRSLSRWHPPLAPGVMVTSVYYADRVGQWLVPPAALHIAYDDAWRDSPASSPYVVAMLASGRLSKSSASASALGGSPVAMLPEALEGLARQQGGLNAALDLIMSDLMDEVNAFSDLCVALACRNVAAKRHDAPVALNRRRIASGKLPLKDFHVLELAGGDGIGGSAGRGGDRSGARAHLRRGHIRRLSADRVTWVNATFVRGRGLVDKAYGLGSMR